MNSVPPGFVFLGLTEIGQAIKGRSVSSYAVTEFLLQRIALLDSDLRSYVRVLEEGALAQARTADAEIASGRHRGPLHGVPIAVKDLCWMKGVPTAAGTVVHRDFVPTGDATVVRRLREAGAVLIGKTQLTEGAYSDYHPEIVPPKNPWNGDYWAGISSSGSAVATAAGLCFGAIASDTGGSIRWPAAANGVTGLKPTWGRVSRHGVFELAASLDHVGAIARSTVDAGAILAAIAGADPLDPTAACEDVPDFLTAAHVGVTGMRIGIDGHWNDDGVDAETRAALIAAATVLAGLGAQLVPIKFPDTTQIVRDWVANCAVEAAVAHETAYARHGDQFGPILASVIDAGRSISGTDYQKILLRRAAFRGRVQTLFGTVDLVLTPAHPFPPLTLAAISTLGEQPDLIARLQRYTCPFDMSGHPTLSLPAGFAQDGMPIGLQLVAGHMQETALVRAGAAFQQETAWHRRHPPLPSAIRDAAQTEAAQMLLYPPSHHAPEHKRQTLHRDGSNP